MKPTHLTALVALAILAASAALYAGDAYGAATGSSEVCRTCPAPAWDRTPIYVQQPNNPYCPPTTPVKAWKVDPWVRCGAFCAAGNIPPGWPYGWGAEYWLRPDTNL